MPTFAKLVAAVLLAALGFFVATLAQPYFSEGTPTGMFPLVTAAFGVVTGWMFTGPKLQRGVGSVVAIGLTTAVVQTLLTTLAFSIKLMVDRAFRMSYDTVMEAVAGVFDAGIEYLGIVAKPDVIVTAVLGAVVITWITKWVAQRTR